MGSGSGSGGNLKSDQGGNWRRKDGPDMLTGRIKNSERERKKVEWWWRRRIKRSRRGEKMEICGERHSRDL